MEIYHARGRAPSSEAGSSNGTGHSSGDSAKYCSQNRVTNGQGLCPTGDTFFFFLKEEHSQMIPSHFSFSSS